MTLVDMKLVLNWNLKPESYFNLAKKDACNVENVEEELRSVEDEDQNNQLDNIEGESETVHS